MEQSHKYALNTKVEIVKANPWQTSLMHRIARIVTQLPGNNQTIGGVEEVCYGVILENSTRISIFQESYLKEIAE